MNKRVIILVISHKPILSENEVLSLKQLYKVLEHFPIKLICPEGLDVSFYIENINNNTDFDFIDPIWQSNYQNFNKLKMSLFLYERYFDYEYILFYEPDAYVFRDELEYWCAKGYDYIGAPWFEGWHEAKPNSPLIGVGNGGFSLRKTDSTIKLLKRMKLYTIIYRLLRIFKILLLCKRLGILENYFKRINKIRSQDINEDYQISVLSKYFCWYKIAPIQVALRFSFDVNPEVLYAMNNNTLPFGCHAWTRYNPNFWKQFIEIL